MKWSTSKLVYKITGESFFIHTEGRFFVEIRHKLKIFLTKTHILFANKFNYKGDIIFSRYICKKCFNPVKCVFNKKGKGHSPERCPRCGESISQLDVENELNDIIVNL